MRVTLAAIPGGDKHKYHDITYLYTYDVLHMYAHTYDIMCTKHIPVHNMYVCGCIHDIYIIPYIHMGNLYVSIFMMANYQTVNMQI